MCCGKGKARRRIRPKSGLKKKTIIKEEKKGWPRSYSRPKSSI
jgi:hypothetical protein